MLDINFWKKYFKTYDILNLVIPYQELMEEIIKDSAVNKGEIVLDAGAGTGNLAARLKQMGVKVIALDNSQEGLDRVKFKNPKIETVCHNLVKSLPFSNDYFDKIVSNNVIYTLPSEDRVKVFKEFYRVLRPGGKIVVSNVREGWKPMKIYADHFKKDIKRNGLVSVIFKAVKMAIPTFKIFYYNAKIKKNEGKGHLIKENEQKELFSISGFKGISENKSVYANQAILNSAVK
jgi:ubiquinone/menaquinone biosynthesis C-methylase UbiE